jgi:hypothetical protein
VQFVVNDKTTISIADPFPNPFTGQVNFKIVVSGNASPELLSMQVISLSGKLVGHYDNNYFSPLHLGTNHLAWRGTDRTGNALSNGVYIYKIMLRAGNTLVEKIGKIVLVGTP